MGKTAIILGATGATGNLLVKTLISDSRYDKIKLFSRSSAGISSIKVEEYLTDLFELEKCSADFTGDEVFCCIGTTKSKTPDEETYRKIDYGIPVAAAKLARKNNINTFIVMSALGADVNSSIFYNRTKGEMQRDVAAAGVPKTYILQPSLILAERDETRVMEKVAAGFMWLINPLLIGGAAKFKSIKAKTIAKAMIWLANNKYDEVIVTSDKLQKLGSKYLRFPA